MYFSICFGISFGDCVKAMEDEERQGYLKEAGDDYIFRHLLNL